MDLDATAAVGERPAMAPEVETEQTFFTIGEMARDFDVSLRALRFYEDRGLIRPLRREHMRLYSARDRVRLQMILRGKQLGFTLVEIREMLAEMGDATPEFELALAPHQILAQIGLLERQREGIERAIGTLKATHEKLESSSFCEGARAQKPAA